MGDQSHGVSEMIRSGIMGGLKNWKGGRVEGWKIGGLEDWSCVMDIPGTLMRSLEDAEEMMGRSSKAMGGLEPWKNWSQ